MKLLITPLVAILILSVTSPDARCQDTGKSPDAFSQDSAKIKKRALFFADSLVSADTYMNWSAYADLAPASVLKHYGSKDAFIEHIEKLHPRTVSAIQEEAPELTITSLMAKDEQWQCVIRESRYIHRDDLKKYHIVTYFLCQSRDEGETWRLFDLGYNKVANVIYMMPDVIGELPIQEPYIISEEDELAQAQAKQQAAARQAPKKGAPKKK
ncbi:MAG TPA: hypothetical protein VGM31_15205 [Puia sp.]